MIYRVSYFLFILFVLGKVVTIDHVILGASSYSLFVCDESGHLCHKGIRR